MNPSLGLDKKDWDYTGSSCGRELSASAMNDFLIL
jgi:hypothetical protein